MSCISVCMIIICISPHIEYKRGHLSNILHSHVVPLNTCMRWLYVIPAHIKLYWTITWMRESGQRWRRSYGGHQKDVCLRHLCNAILKTNTNRIWHWPRSHTKWCFIATVAFDDLAAWFSSALSILFPARFAFCGAVVYTHIPPHDSRITNTIWTIEEEK